MDNLSYDTRMDKAIRDLDLSLTPNYTAVAKKWKVGRYALSRRFQGQTTLRGIAASKYQRCLIDN